MTENNIKNLIEQASRYAEQQEWQKALNFLQEAYQIDPENPGLLTGIGTCLLNLGQVSESIPYFKQAAETAADSPEAYNNLGVAYLVNKDLVNAEIAFKQALWLDEDNQQSWKNLAQVYLNQKETLSEGLQILASVVKANPSDTEALFQLALSYEIGGDYKSAKDVLERILEIDPYHSQAKQVLQDIQQQSSRDEQVRKLASLRTLMQKDSTVKPPQTVAEAAPIPPASTPVRELKAVFYTPDEYTSFERLPAITRTYNQKNYKVSSENAFSPEHIDEYDLIILSNPLLAPWLIDAANQCIQKEKPFAIDLDIDFYQIGPDHPAYAHVGPGNQRAIQVLNILLNEAKLVTASSKNLCDRLQAYAKAVEPALPVWDSGLPGWNRPGPRHSQVQIGWMGSIGDFPDLKYIKTPVEKYLQENPEAVWVAIGCDEAYDLFDNLPEERRMFLPSPTLESLPYLLSNLDIILLPMLNNPFNQSKSDVPLLYAGIRKIPWIASKNRAVEEWQSGGYIAETKDQWYTHIKTLAENKELRVQLGEAGKNKAEERKL